MIVEVCGLREPENIRAVEQLAVDRIGFIFHPRSPRYLPMIPSSAGIIPDRPVADMNIPRSSRVSRLGVFMDEMPQNIVTRVYNYRLDAVRLQGTETREACENLRRTLDPDICPGIAIIKGWTVRTVADIRRWKDYEGAVDAFFFHLPMAMAGDRLDLGLLEAYDGNIPFIIGGDIAPEDASRLGGLRHPMFMGVSLNTHFETAAGIKDIEKLQSFLERLRDGRQTENHRHADCHH